MVLSGLINVFGSILKQAIDNRDTKSIIYISSVVTVISIFTFATFSSKQNNDKDYLPALTIEEAKTIMSEFSDKVKMLGARMINATENIKQQLAQQNQHVPDIEIMKAYILPHLTSGMKEIQDKLLIDNNVEELELEEAVDTYINQGDKTLLEIKRKIRSIYKQFGGEISNDDDDNDDEFSDPPKDVPLNLLLTALSEMSEVIDVKLDEYIDSFKSKHGPPSDQSTFELFQQGMLFISEDAQRIVLEQLNISVNDFDTALRKHQTNKSLQVAYMKLQENSQKKLYEAGMIPSMQM